MDRTKVVGYADDLTMATRGESITAVENYTNVELSKIKGWAKNNKIKFNDTKSKVMLVSRMKRKENKNITVCLNNKPLELVTQIKYLGTHNIRSREMRKTNTQLIKRGEINMED